MAKRHIPPLVHGRVRLRQLAEVDLPMTLAWRNQDHIRKWFFDSDVITSDQHRRWFERYREKDDDFVFIIEETETLRRPVGQLALYNIDWPARRGEFGRLMIGDAEARGLRLATLATSCLATAATDEWGLSEVHLEVLPGNQAALAVYRACGFVSIPSAGPGLLMSRRKEPPPENLAVP